MRIADTTKCNDEIWVNGDPIKCNKSNGHTKQHIGNQTTYYLRHDLIVNIQWRRKDCE